MFTSKPRQAVEKFGVRNLSRFAGYIRKTKGCWIWTGSKAKKSGRALFSLIVAVGKHKTVKASRYYWEYKHGPIPAGMEVCHSCDNPKCIRLSHFFLGTHNDNMQDMVRKKRNVRGTDCHNAKLSEEDVRDIRKLLEKETIRGIAKIYNVWPATIHGIKTKRIWKHVL